MEQTKNKSIAKLISKLLLVVASVILAASYFFPYVDFERMAEDSSIDELIWELEKEEDIPKAQKEELISILENYSDVDEMSNGDFVKMFLVADEFHAMVQKVLYVIVYGPIVIGLVCAIVAVFAKRSGGFVIPLILSLVSVGFYSLVKELFDSDDNMAGIGLDIAIMAGMAIFVLSIVCMVVHKKKRMSQFQQIRQGPMGQFSMNYGQNGMKEPTDYNEHAANSPISYGSQDMGSFLNEINQNNNQQ